ncbi:MAG: DUF2927 domain-containing protein [Microscillaceae bacterium]|nr:DUF2927 domain-containing protein [Microscillaceae bacterium]
MQSIFLKIEGFSHFVGAFLGLCLCLGLSARPVFAQRLSPSQQAYFYAIALGREYGEACACIQKWTHPIRIYTDGAWNRSQTRLLDKILRRLHRWAGPLSFEWARQPGSAHLIIFRGEAQAFARQYVPQAARWLTINQGFFWLEARPTGEIQKAWVYVGPDTLRTRLARHLLWEELIQSLGLGQDSELYQRSIFFQGWSTRSRPSSIDRKLIRCLYQPEVQPGMSRAMLETVLGGRR